MATLDLKAWTKFMEKCVAQAACDMYTAGMSIEAIATRLHITVADVQYYLFIYKR